jgi:membrane protein implicated in regulation of membrane protease activity
VIPVRLLVFGNAPPWAAFFLWLALTVVIVLLWRGIRREAERERERRNRRLDNHEHRLRELENYLAFEQPPEEEEQWPNSASNR